MFAVGGREVVRVGGWCGGIIVQEKTLCSWIKRSKSVSLRGRHFRSIYTGEV